MLLTGCMPLHACIHDSCRGIYTFTYTDHRCSLAHGVNMPYITYMCAAEHSYTYIDPFSLCQLNSWLELSVDEEETLREKQSGAPVPTVTSSTIGRGLVTLSPGIDVTPTLRALVRGVL